MVKVTIYVEGGGDSRQERIRCRQGFRKLLEKAGFQGRMPGITACGGRESAYQDFCTATSSRGRQDAYPILLVDSEDPVQNPSAAPDSPAAWEHLGVRDNWGRPDHIHADQAQLMATCMETWIMADPHTLRSVFGPALQESALLPLPRLEQRSRQQVQDALEHATRNSGRDKAYRKGRRSFQVLEQLSPAALDAHLPHFQRLKRTLERHCPSA
ncbi:MAG: DUF4276 family protein [Caldilineaceae bacterium]|nr:DUF4276 family protein [Caldilineaceae bacterium]MBP8109684.1 DUF4276 family protein [Caldilineaceae bacterium]MBP8124486.1 DUF4276 family protein [Caldilineaceae bacterium]